MICSAIKIPPPAKPQPSITYPDDVREYLATITDVFLTEGWREIRLEMEILSTVNNHNSTSKIVTWIPMLLRGICPEFYQEIVMYKWQTLEALASATRTPILNGKGDLYTQLIRLVGRQVVLTTNVQGRILAYLPSLPFLNN